MQARLVLLLLAMLLCRLSADKLETYQDFRCRNSKKVTLYQAATYGYTLNKQTDLNLWYEYPSLGITAKIPFSQNVRIKYHVNNFSDGPCYFSAQISVDGTWHSKFRTITGYTLYHTHIDSNDVWLEKGVHFIAVIYNSNCVWSIQHPYGHYIAFIEVSYKQGVP